MLRSKHSLSKPHRLSIWRSCVHTASTCGLTSRGVTAKGSRRLTLETMKQIRLVIGDPAHMTRTSHAQILEDWNLQHPIEEQKARMLDENSAEDDPCAQNSTDPWWKRAMESFIAPSEDTLVQIPSHTVGMACPTCSVMYLDRTSTLIHMSKAHKQDPLRPANQPVTFDKSRDAKNGLHICKHCDKTMCDWSSLRKHILEKRCSVLFSKPEFYYGHGDERLFRAPAPGARRDDVEANSQGSREAKSQRTENGKGRGHQPPHYTSTSRRGRPQRQGQDLDLHQAVKAQAD